MTDPNRPSRQPADSLPTSRQRLLALSGIAFAVLLCIAWFANGAETPHYTAPDHAWTTWANNTEMKGRFAAFFALLAGLVFLPFAATIRDMLATAERTDHGGVRLSQVAYAGGLIGVTSFVIATVTFSGASAEGAQANPVVSRAIARITTRLTPGALHDPRRNAAFCRLISASARLSRTQGALTTVS